MFRPKQFREEDIYRYDYEYTYQEDNYPTNKTLDPIEYFQTIAQIGGNDWTKMPRGFALNSMTRRLVKIASHVGAVHLATRKLDAVDHAVPQEPVI